ncbi:hypothetical protein DERP_001553 [Dermatophagoides pteronyssinus]|uniref:Uncharacterized protein n=1 Tax=Dermatophagoides pteronyssinus TaxID=6956 RepID=A0ABQ8JAU5_DERPT|nr:hypothetical protein DERP_001553 [Dermatophagoides pteronyssinus]
MNFLDACLYNNKINDDHISIRCTCSICSKNLQSTSQLFVGQNVININNNINVHNFIVIHVDNFNVSYDFNSNSGYITENRNNPILAIEEERERKWKKRISRRSLYFAI